MVEQETVNLFVAGSSPAPGAKFKAQKEVVMKHNLEDLIKECDPNAECPDDLRNWENMKDIGNEIVLP